MRIGCQIGMWGREEMSFEAVIEEVGRLGYGGLEVFLANIAAYYGKAEELKAKLKKANIVLTGAYFGMDDSLDPEKEPALLARAAEACRFLQAVGSRYLILNGGADKKDGPFSDDDYRRVAQVMNRIGKEAQALGVDVVMHPHIGYMVELPTELDQLVAAGIDRKLVGLCPHAGHQMGAGADPYIIYEKYPAWVRYLHIADTGSDKKGASVGAGVLDQKRLMKPLLEAGYDGWVIIEGGQREVSAKDYANRSREYMLKTWPQVKCE